MGKPVSHIIQGASVEEMVINMAAIGFADFGCLSGMENEKSKNKFHQFRTRRS
jgi:hypothetical protein